MTTNDEQPTTGYQQRATEKIWLRATDLKQWAYCPRIVFYNQCMSLTPPATPAMQAGSDLHQRIELLERRRKLRPYNLSNGERRFEVWLKSRQHGLSGKLDMLVTTPEGRYPIDFKMAAGGIGENHRLQLAAYALMLEEQFACEVRTGFIYLLAHRNATVVDINADLRQRLFAGLKEVRTMIQAERFPGPVAERGKCWDCEYKLFCNDVF